MRPTMGGGSGRPRRSQALMSGGVIILITAGGGAFGDMLRAAGVENSITGFVGAERETAGIILLLLGFGVATVMKIAQGSSTVAMMVTAAMFAAISQQVMSSSEIDFADLVKDSATPGGLNEQALEIIRGKGAYDAFQTALDAIADRLGLNTGEYKE